MSVCVILSQITVLKEALGAVKSENRRLLGSKMKQQLASLAPLQVPKKPMGLASTTGTVSLGEILGQDPAREDMRKLTKDTNSLLNVSDKIYQQCKMYVIKYTNTL